MSKTSFFIFIAIVLLILGVGGWYLFLRTDKVASPAETGTSTSPDLFPFGRRPADSETEGGLVTEPGEASGNDAIDLGSETEEIPRLRQISAVPTAGAVAYNVGSTTLFRYIERATGHIYETSSDSLEVKKISNTTIPKVHEALWAADGKELLIRYVKEDTEVLRTFYARISTTTRPEQAIEGIFLADDIRDASVSGNKMFYLAETSSGSNGIISNLDSSSRNSVFASSFTDWRAILSSPSRAVIFTRPSGNVEGALYSLNLSNGSYAKVSGGLGIAGVGNTDNSFILLSTMENRRLASRVYDTKEGSVVSLGLDTLADKCVWSARNKSIVYCAVPRTIPSAVYPDDWYKGKISFDDGLWKIDVQSGETESIMDPELDAGISMDIFKLSLDKNETALIFTDKKDMSVWAYRLE